MAYEVLARKWRPQTFHDMVGQGHVLKALIHALDHDRLHHAYLFTGTRGVGKTTVARILARCLNCDQGVSSTPCGECGSCRSILDGRFVDLLEIDAASRTGVDDMRELLDNVQYAPVAGRYKVYLIDEVHMLTNNSFNALLKTLEEPPPHIVFLLATTDPKKLPMTVLSRCLQFHLKNMLPAEITGQLTRVLDGEGIEHDAGSLALLARGAMGSMRDALSLADQAVAYGGGTLTEANVAEMLGTVRSDEVARLLLAVAADDGPGVIALCDGLAEAGADFQMVLDEIARALHRVMLTQLVGAADGDDADAVLPAQVRSQLASQLAPETVQLLYQIAVDGRGSMHNAPEPRIGFEVTMLRMLAFRPVEAGAAPVAQGGGHGAATSGQDAGPPASPAPARQASARAAHAERRPPGATPTEDDWYALVAAADIDGVARSVLERCVPDSVADGQWRLILDAGFSALLQADHARRIGAALTQACGQPVNVTIDTGTPGRETPAARKERLDSEARAAARRELDGDSVVQQLVTTFNATLVEDSVRPNSDG